ncbi:MAG: hypothetical protein R3Y53_05365 [Bacillota bacterium]
MAGLLTLLRKVAFGDRLSWRSGDVDSVHGLKNKLAKMQAGDHRSPLHIDISSFS